MMGKHDGPLGVYRLDSVSVWDARVSVVSVVFVHLFSGFCRCGDLHWHIEHHDWTHGIECFCLSIDLCIQREEGDLLDPKRVQWWKERIQARQVLGIGAPLARPGQQPDGWAGVPLRYATEPIHGGSTGCLVNSIDKSKWAQGSYKLQLN